MRTIVEMIVYIAMTPLVLLILLFMAGVYLSSKLLDTAPFRKLDKYLYGN